MSGTTAGQRLGYIGAEAREKGTELLNNFFSGFSGVKTAIDNSKEFLRKNGYVEDFVGRRRRLTDINITPYEAKLHNINAEDLNFNPFICCSNRVLKNDPILIWNQILFCYMLIANAHKISKNSTDLSSIVITKEMFNSTFEWLRRVALNPSAMLDKPYNEDKQLSKWNTTNKAKILADLKQAESILIDHSYKGSLLPSIEAFDALVDEYIHTYGKCVPGVIPTQQVDLIAWTGRRAQAERQCFNARVQGGAGSLTKLAMVNIYNDPLLRSLDAKLIISVHDEVLVECPAYYADQVEKRLPELMIGAAKQVGDDLPQDCDPYNVSRWYADVESAAIIELYKKLEANGYSAADALEAVCKEHSEIPRTAIESVISGKAEELIF